MKLHWIINTVITVLARLLQTAVIALPAAAAVAVIGVISFAQCWIYVFSGVTIIHSLIGLIKLIRLMWRNDFN